jgi:beta-galactosidase
MVVDEKGVFVPHADPELSFLVSGAGRLIGLENGDPLDATNYKIESRRAFRGMALAVIQAGDSAGRIQVSVTSKGLEPANITVDAVEG